MRKTTMIAATLALTLGAAGAQTTATTTTTQVTLTDVPAGHWAKDAVDAIVRCGLIQGFPDGTFRGNENLTRYQAALIFHRLLTSGAMASCGFSQTDTTAIVKGMQEVSAELAAISARVTDLEKASADQAARIAALEERINALNAGTGNADLTALNARIDALELAVRNIPAGPQGPAGPAGPAGPQGPAGPAGATGVAPEPVVTTPVVTTPVVIGEEPVVDIAVRNLYAGVGLGMQSSATPCYIPRAGGTAVPFCFSVGGVLGSKSLIGPVGARVSFDYIPAFNAFRGDVNAMYHLDAGGMISPYIGAGLGLSSGESRTSTTASATDTYANLILGTDIMFTDSLGAFVEANGRYYLSNNSYATGLATNANNGIGFGVKAGVKFFF